ncbi:POM121-like protein 1, partial [Heterocephalus glaber]
LMEQQAQHRRGTYGPGKLPSAFRPVEGQQGVIPFVPRPGPLCRKYCRQSSRDKPDPCSQPSCVSSLIRRNAITSSYSSSGGLAGLQRRALATIHTRPLLGPSKDPRENGFQYSCSGPQVPSNTGNKVADVTSRQAETRRNCVPTVEDSGRGKRKTPLLRPRQGVPLTLLPPPKLSYEVTPEDIAGEKEAARRRINEILLGESQAKVRKTTQPSCPPPLPAPGTAPCSVPAVPNRKGRETKNRKKQDSKVSGGPLAPAAVATSVEPGSKRKSTLAAPLLSSQPLPVPSSHTTDAAPSSSAPVPSPAAGKDSIRRGKTPALPRPSVGECFP